MYAVVKLIPQYVMIFLKLLYYHWLSASRYDDIAVSLMSGGFNAVPEKTVAFNN